MTDRNAYASKARFLGPEMLPERPEVNPETGQRLWASGEARNRSYTGRFPGEARSRLRRASRKARRQALRRQGRPAHAGQAAGSQEAGSPGSMQATQAGRPGRQAGQAACRPGAMQARCHAGKAAGRPGNKQASFRRGQKSFRQASFCWAGLPESPGLAPRGLSRAGPEMLQERPEVNPETDQSRSRERPARPEIAPPQQGFPERPEVVSAGFQRSQTPILLGRADVLRPAAPHRRLTQTNSG